MMKPKRERVSLAGCEIVDPSTVAAGGVRVIGHLLDPAVRQPHRVGAVNIAQSVPSLLDRDKSETEFEFYKQSYLDIEGGSIADITNIVLKLVRWCVLSSLRPCLKSCYLRIEFGFGIGIRSKGTELGTGV